MVTAWGRPLAVMAVLALVGGAALWLRPPSPRADLVVWVLAPDHARLYRQSGLLERFERRTGKSVRVELVSSQAIDTRLLSLIMSGRRGAGVPDLVELEIGSVGKFLRAPVEDVGLWPLDDLLERSGARLIAARLAAWSKRGIAFAVPLDVHPVTIAYREDLFDAAGIQIGSSETWKQFRERCLAAQRVWGGTRRAIALPRNSADGVYLMLLQRGINILDEDNRVHLSDPRVAETVAFYAQLVAGANRIAADVPAGETLWARDLAQGAVAAALTPDWRIGELEALAPSLSGKVRMMALPRFAPDDAPTATWGGTAMAIPRGARDPARSWELLEALCLSPEAASAQWRLTGIVPAVQGASPPTAADDDYFGGQAVDVLYAQLARRIPARRVTAYTTLAMQALGLVVTRAADHTDAYGTDGLEAACRAWLLDAQRDVVRYIAFAQPDGHP